MNDLQTGGGKRAAGEEERKINAQNSL